MISACMTVSVRELRTAVREWACCIYILRGVYWLHFNGVTSMESLGTFLLCCFTSQTPKSTAMVIAGRSVHLTTLFPGQA